MNKRDLEVLSEKDIETTTNVLSRYPYNSLYNKTCVRVSFSVPGDLKCIPVQTCWAFFPKVLQDREWASATHWTCQSGCGSLTPKNRENQAAEVISLGQRALLQVNRKASQGYKQHWRPRGLAMARAISMEMPLSMLLKPPAQFPGYGWESGAKEIVCTDKSSRAWQTRQVGRIQGEITPCPNLSYSLFYSDLNLICLEVWESHK